MYRHKIYAANIGRPLRRVRVEPKPIPERETEKPREEPVRETEKPKRREKVPA